ncbi:MAG: SDR family NAD(P)-dependent oxidoreductase [Omnitrophica WOR_2 bacterium]
MTPSSFKWEFNDQVALVTGAGRGTGREIAVALAECGAVVAANDITPVNLDDTLARILAGGGNARDYVFDVAKRMPVQAMVDQVMQDWGHIDILVNCASVKARGMILEIDEWDWQRSLDVNLSGPFYLMQQVGRLMRDRGGGAILNLVSAAAESPPSGAAFTASKMGLIELTREAARELGAYHIRVNAVCPGWVESGLPGAYDSGSIPIKRPETNEEVVNLILFLCSEAASDITGQVMCL